MFCREGTVEVNGNHADFLAFGHEMVDSFLSGLGYRTHGDDHALSFGMSVVVEEVVFATCDGRDLAHVVFNDFGNSIIVFVARFAVLEEYVAVFCHTTCHGSQWAEGAVAEFSEGFLVNQGSEVFLINNFDLLDLVRGTEAVEEVYEGNAALDGREVGYTGEIHHFLNGTFSKHCEAGLAYRHNVLMVAEDAQCVRGDCTGRYVEHTGEQLACDLVHIGDHQQQTLRCGVGRCQSTGLE